MTASATRGLKTNFATMLLWQVGNYLVPLATFPYLTRTLGPGEFGALGIAAAIAAYCGVVAEWGFNLSGPRAVVECKECPQALNALIWSTMAAKACLCLLSGVAVAVALTLSASLASLKFVVFFSWLSVVGNVATLNWLFQGLERFGLFAVVSLAGRFLALPLTFLLVKSSADTAIAAAIQAAAQLLSGLFSLVIVQRMGLLKRPTTSWRQIGDLIAKGSHTFVSTASVSLFGATNALILGSVAGANQVGMYTAADKLKTVANTIPAQINTVLYPRIARLFKDDQRAASRLTVLGAIATVAVTSAGLLMSVWLARPLVTLVMGSEFEASARVLQLLCLATLFGNLAYFLGLQVLVPFGKDGKRSVVMVMGGLFNVALAFVLTSRFGATRAAASFAFAEALILAMYVHAIASTPSMKNHFTQLVES